MAFGLFKKLISVLTGKGDGSAKRGGKNGKNGGKGSHKNHNGAAGGKGHNGKQRGNVPHGGRGGKPNGGNGGKGGNAGKPNAGRHEERNQRHGNGERRHEGRRDERRGPRPVNTAANEMRPGGEISAEERSARQAAHASWKIEDFKVEPQEGKKRFHDFNLPSEVMHGIADLGFQYCTEIQALSLANALEGKNIAGKAQTGSGKTAAFLVAILTRYLRTPEQRAQKGGEPRALVIAPTRELVIQICKDADAIGKYCDLRSLAIYGGMDYDRQREELQASPVDLLVATPGRLLDFCNQRVVNLMHVDTLVIDEADRMLDMGFIPDVRRIMGRLPPKDKRATMLYSATLTDDVMQLASQWMEEPVRAEVETDHNATDTVRQVVYIVRADDKFKVLFNHIALHPEARAIVFCNRKSTTEDVHDSLRRRGVSCEMLSGDVNQNKRLQVLDAFREGKVKIVVATDVAGRGIHVDDIEYVINFDFPYEAEDYVHRIGRTGRAGNTGIAISFADEDESFEIPKIEEYIHEPLKCTMLQDDDPLLKPLEHLRRGESSELKPVDEAAKAAVDAREAVTEEEKAAAAALVGGIIVKTASGRESVIPDPVVAPVTRKEPTFERALDVQKPKDATDAYAKRSDQQTRFEEWTVEAKPAEPISEANPAETVQSTEESVPEKPVSGVK